MCGKNCVVGTLSIAGNYENIEHIFDLFQVTSRGDAGTHCLGNEQVHMGIQASGSETSLKKSSDIMSRVAFNAQKHSELLKKSDESIGNPLQSGTPKRKPTLKRAIQTQADLDSAELIKPRKTGISVHFANSKDGLDIEKSLMFNSFIADFSGIVDLSSLPVKDTDQPTTSANSQGNTFQNVEESVSKSYKQNKSSNLKEF